MPSCVTHTASTRVIGRYRLSRVLFAALLAGIVSQSLGAFVGMQQQLSRQGKTIASSLEASLSSEEVRSRLISQLEKLRLKDRQAKVVSKEVSAGDGYLILLYWTPEDSQVLPFSGLAKLCHRT